MIGLKQPRIRDAGHIKRLHLCRCAVPNCWRSDIEVHHLTCGPEPKARGLKAGDDFTLPVCRNHHDPNSRDSLHFMGDERKFWEKFGVDPIALAQGHWAETQRLREVGEWPQQKTPKPRKSRTA